MQQKAIACFGASLTEGYCARGTKFFPYGTYLQTLLGKKDYLIESYGVSGETTRDMIPRLRVIVLNKRKWDAIIVLGGVNDIGRGYSPQSVYSNLKTILTDITQANAIPILLNIPPVGSNLFDANHLQTQQELNSLIYKLSTEIDSCIFVDLFHSVCDETKTILRKDVADVDGLHFTKFGYEEMAKTIFDQVNWTVLK